jgi:AcrR family transcriptional regulator
MDRPTPLRTRILEISRGLFIERGFSATNIRDVAEAAGVSMGGLYHHFANKEEIFEASLSNFDLLPQLQAVAALILAPEFPDTLPAIARLLRETIRKNADFFKLAYVDVLEFQGRHVRPVIQNFRRAYGAFASQVFEDKVAEGKLADANARVLLVVTTDLIVHFCLTEIMLQESQARDAGLSDDAFLDEMCGVLLDGVRGRGTPPRSSRGGGSAESKE